jgi:hypothetical protein
VAIAARFQGCQTHGDSPGFVAGEVIPLASGSQPAQA